MKNKREVLVKLFSIYIISKCIYIWRRLCDRHADEEKVCG